MYIQEFKHNNLVDLNEWRKARGMTEVTATPKIGHMTYFRGEPVAVAFIREVEGGFGILDGLCTNPEFPGDIRSSAIDMLVNHLISIAKEQNMTALLAWSNDKNTLVRSLSHGFVQLPQTMIVANLISIGVSK